VRTFENCCPSIRLACSTAMEKRRSPECQRELKTIEAAVSLVEGVDEFEPPAGMWEAVLSQIAAPAPVERPGFREWLQGWFAPRRAAAALAAAAVAVAVVYGYVKFPAPSTAYQATASVYVEEHIQLASQDAFANRFGLASISEAASEEETGTR
jgi:hypothetical protein